jgi:hypothetical protein
MRPPEIELRKYEWIDRLMTGIVTTLFFYCGLYGHWMVLK